MLNFFRNFTKSRYGLIAVFVFLGIIALAFAAGDVTGIRAMGGGSGGTVATVGGTKITDADVRERIDRFLALSRRQGQNITMEQFLAQGGLDIAIDELINSAALVEFAKKSGMQVSKKLIDADIANTAAFFGIDGKFNQQNYERMLAESRFTPAAYRDGLTRDRYAGWLVNRATIGGQVPDGVALPYASLWLERRTGIVGMVNTAAMDPGPDPDDKTLNAYYVSHRARYMVPQRRIVRYAAVQPDALKAQNAATEAEISAAYAKAGTRYAATEKRSVRQLVAIDQATANKVAAEVKGGKTLAAAAAAVGLEPTNFEAVEKAELIRQTSQGIADAAFGANQGAVVGPIRSALGWHVLQVEKVEKIAAKSLAQAHDELAAEITQRKTAQTLANLRQLIEDGVADGKTFDEAVREAKLTVQTTPALAADGTNPDDAAYKPDQAMGLIMRTAFTMEQAGAEPQVIQISQEGAFALVSVERIVPAAARPLNTIQDRVKSDYLVDKALEKARGVATQVVAALEKGVPMQKALADAGVTKGPPPKPFDFKRSEIRDKENFIQMAFSMRPKKAKMVAAPDRKGYYIVFLDQIEEHSAANDPVTMAGVRGALEQQAGAEYAGQFVRSVRQAIKIKRDEAAIARLRAELSRQGATR